MKFTLNTPLEFATNFILCSDNKIELNRKFKRNGQTIILLSRDEIVEAIPSGEDQIRKITTVTRKAEIDFNDVEDDPQVVHVVTRLNLYHLYTRSVYTPDYLPGNQYRLRRIANERNGTRTTALLPDLRTEKVEDLYSLEEKIRSLIELDIFPEEAKLYRYHLDSINGTGHWEEGSK